MRDDIASLAESEENGGELSPDATSEAAAESSAEVQPTTLAKAQSAAAEREQGEEVGDTGAALLSHSQAPIPALHISGCYGRALLLQHTVNLHVTAASGRILMP